MQITVGYIISLHDWNVTHSHKRLVAA